MEDNIALCTMIYGKLNRLYNYFYITADEKHIVDIRTAEEILPLKEASLSKIGGIISPVNYKVLNNVFVIKNAEKKSLTIYRDDCTIVEHLEPTHYLRMTEIYEYESKKSNKLIIYLRGYTSSLIGRALLLDLTTKELLHTFNYVENLIADYDELEMYYYKNNIEEPTLTERMLGKVKRQVYKIKISS